jgi:hypothetical protein
MRKIIVCSIVSLLFLASAYAQNANVLDTIRVAALQSFNAPSVGALVLGNVLKVDFTCELLNEGMQKIRDPLKVTQKPKKEDFAKYVTGGRGTTVWVVVTDAIEEPGTYYIKIGVNASGEVGALKKDFYYMVIVSNPKIAAPVVLRDKYFFSEKETFSFATVDYPDPTLYSFEILDGSNVVYSGSGPVVQLDSMLRTQSYVGKTLKVVGKYQGKEFTYFEGSTGSTKRSTWEFSIAKPNLENLHNWEIKPNDQWLLSVYNKQSLAFWFVYIGNTPNGFAVTVPEITGLRVTSDPDNFVGGASGNRISGSFRIVDVSVNEEFLNQMQVGDEQQVKLKITFRTQFGESVTKEYYAVIIK